jgi:hypothetical protein
MRTEQGRSTGTRSRSGVVWCLERLNDLYRVILKRTKPRNRSQKRPRWVDLGERAGRQGSRASAIDDTPRQANEFPITKQFSSHSADFRQPVDDSNAVAQAQSSLDGVTVFSRPLVGYILYECYLSPDLWLSFAPLFNAMARHDNWNEVILPAKILPTSGLP